MARSVLASELLARLRYATDTEGDTHVSDTELYKQLTAAVAVTWDKILANGLGTEYVKSVLFTATSGTSDYSLATVCPAGDFYKVKTLYVSDGSGGWRPIERVSAEEQYGLRGPSATTSMKLHYVPCAPKFTTGNESFDGINGWEEHTIQVAAIKVKAKKQDDTGPFRAQVRELEEEMKTHANRNAGSPPRVIRRRAAVAWANRIAPYIGGVSNWDIMGADTLTLFAPSYGLYA